MGSPGSDPAPAREGDGFRVADAGRVEGVLRRIAARMHAELPANLALVGIRRRGLPLAERLGERLGQLRGHPIPVHAITVKRYADDLALLYPRPEIREASPGFAVTHRTLVLVDDVLYTGHTLLRSAAWLVDAGAQRVRFAVLCARGRPEVPARADFVGLRFDVDEGCRIEVRVPPYEPELGIVLRRLRAPAAAP